MFRIYVCYQKQDCLGLAWPIYDVGFRIAWGSMQWNPKACLEALLYFGGLVLLLWMFFTIVHNKWLLSLLK